MARVPKREITREREKLVWELRLQSLNQYAIRDRVNATHLGPMTQQAVSAMLRRIEARSLAEMSERVKAEKIVQHDVYEKIKRVAWAEYIRSQKAGVTVRTKTTTIELDQGRGKVEVPSEEVTRTVTGRLGDHRYLDTIIKANAGQAKLWGLDAAPTDPPPDQGAADPEVARRALMAAGGEADTTGDDDGDG